MKMLSDEPVELESQEKLGRRQNSSVGKSSTSLSIGRLEKGQISNPEWIPLTDRRRPSTGI